MTNILKLLEDLHPEHDFSKSKDFISDGLLDSFDIITLVAALEEKFNIHINGEDVISENFKNLDALEKFIKKCLLSHESQIFK